jgi:GNAT superfamily N-acetyltransferase
MSILIRDATHDDVATLADFNVRLAMETEDVDLDPSTVEKGVAAVIDDAAKGRYFVATNDGEVVGCLMITLEWSDWRNGDLWWIQSVYVEPGHRGSGVFRTLHAAARHAALNANARGLRLYVERHNEAAVATYTKLGMVDAGYFLMEEMFPDGGDVRC